MTLGAASDGVGPLCRPSARGPFDQLGDPRLARRREAREGEGDRPHLLVVESCVGLEAQRRVAHLKARPACVPQRDPDRAVPWRPLGLARSSRAGRYHRHVTASGYFIAASVVLLLGSVAMPTALAAYAFASVGRDAASIAAGIWASFVILVALGGPVVLTIAGLLKLFLRGDQD